MHFEAGRIGAGGIAGGKISNRLFLAVLVDLKVVSLEIGEERSFLVGDRHAEVHQLDAGAKDRHLLGGRSGPGDGRRSQRSGEDDPGVLHQSALYTRLLNSGTHGVRTGSGRPPEGGGNGSGRSKDLRHEYITRRAERSAGLVAQDVSPAHTSDRASRDGAYNQRL